MSKMPISTIHRFNPFKLKTDFNHANHGKIQEVVYYAESRFWCIINEISKADVIQQDWTQKLLLRELVPFFFHFSF